MKKITKLSILSLLSIIGLSACGSSSSDNSSNEVISSIEQSSQQENESIEVGDDVASIIVAIDKIGDVGPNSGALIDAISEKFAKLTIDNKKLVTNYKLLFAAQKEFAMRDGFVKGEFDDKNIVKRLGVMSDIHASDNLIPALEIMGEWDDEGIDALVISGDITDGVRYYDTGINEINKVKNIILGNVDDDLPIVMALGNHDTSNGSHCSVFYDNLGERFYSNIDDKEITREKGLSHAVVAGYHFITLECDYTTVANEGITKDAEKYLADKMEEIVTSPDYHGEYIFIVTHLLPSGTTYDSSNSTAINKILEFYPQAFVIAGHTHQTIHDELSIDQNRFTVVNPGSVSYLWAGNNTLEANGYGVIYGDQYTSYNLPNGAIFEIDASGNIRIQRLDLRRSDLVIGNPWVISAPKVNNSHLCLYTRDRMDDKYNNEPYFSNGNNVTASYTQVSGKYNVSITFDTAKDDDLNDYIYWYDVNLKDENGFSIKTFLTFSEFYLYANRDKMPETKTIKIEGITNLPMTLVIRPMDGMRCYGDWQTYSITY